MLPAGTLLYSTPGMWPFINCGYLKRLQELNNNALPDLKKHMPYLTVLQASWRSVRAQHSLLPLLKKR
jgi:hypothetical protein